ncbi:MAG: signal peptidase I [Gammaproteobacteria bacterium]|nr:signal peptidase I [Gammaproteobacteria bacterium]
MDFDFPTFLVLFTLLTGLIWLVDVIFFAPKRQLRVVALRESAVQISEDELKKVAAEPYLVEMAHSFFPVVALVLVVRSFWIEPFRIPSGSMMPTLLAGDFILVNKYAYGIRLPALNRKIIDIGQPQRGEVVVFRYPEDLTIDYIKRVVGVPGETIAYIDKVLYVNGERADLQPYPRYVGSGMGAVQTGSYHFKETVADKSRDILVMPTRPRFDFEFTVPPNEYFVMGDNRDNSRDSRYWGTVSDDLLIGKAVRIWMNWDSSSEKMIDWSRLGEEIL